MLDPEFLDCLMPSKMIATRGFWNHKQNGGNKSGKW